jgi:spoIIIJ-associated protein
MEWVETLGKTVAEAIEAALDELGVDEQDAEVVIVEEPKSGLLGLRRSQARVRARVRPAAPRPKRPQRSRRGDERGRSRSRSGGGGGGGQNRPATQVEDRDAESASVVTEKAPGRSGRGGSGRSRSNRSRSGQDAATTNGGARKVEETAMTIEEQSSAVEAFVSGVVEQFGFTAETSAHIDDENIVIEVTGEGLGLLVGPRGATLDALQELARTVAQRRTDERGARVLVDVAGFRARRAQALEEFVRRIVDEVVESGVAQALEPMGAPDRKIVHDVVNSLSGVSTTSEGVEPRRFVVIRPADTSSAATDVDEDDDVDDDLDEDDDED